MRISGPTMRAQSNSLRRVVRHGDLAGLAMHGRDLDSLRQKGHHRQE